MILTKELWDKTPVPQRVLTCMASGLGGRIGSKSWDDLDDDEVMVVMGLKVPVYDSGTKMVGWTDGDIDTARVAQKVEQDKPLVQGILAKYLRGTRSGNGSNGRAI